ncbi:MAG: DOMON-like domain-containing protein [Phormidesmis sp. RL_2_1]|nr:DOMON-like domain-containing protein [Phormidesmis sp. RL_2_1]
MSFPINDAFGHSSQHFQLLPFQPNAHTQNIAIKGNVLRDGSQLSVAYWIEGDWEKVIIPDLRFHRFPERRDRLWEKTCFEFFLAAVDANSTHTKDNPYWEINLSPEGHWNVFSFMGYRHSMRVESAIATLPFNVRTSPTGLHLEIVMDTSALIAPDKPIQIGISMVTLLKTEADPAEAFWAITHPSTEADFHHPDSLAMQLIP